MERVRRSQGYMLSGGERRRVEIARSMVIDPNVREALKRVYLGESFSLQI